MLRKIRNEIEQYYKEDIDANNNQFKLNRDFFEYVDNNGIHQVFDMAVDDVDLKKGIIDVNHTLVYYDYRIAGGRKGCHFGINTPKTKAGERQVTMLGFMREAFEIAH